MQRRTFLSAMMGGAVALQGTSGRAGAIQGGLRAGEGVADITPPLGIEMAGFHKPPGQERRIKGIRQPCAVRALVLALGPTQVAICSLDTLGVDEAMAGRIQRAAAERTGIPAENIRVGATHDHSMPTFNRRLRQWGALPPEFMATVERRTVEAIAAARADLAPAELSLGKCRAPGGNHNRTVKGGVAKTDAEFGPQSTDAGRWLDTMLHAMVFRRAGKKPDLVWYHFSAHAVCYADDQAGPDWPGEVAQEIRKQLGLRPSFLQGHIGDVNPGDGSDWKGEIRQTVAAMIPALKQAIATARPRRVDCLRTRRTRFNVPFDMERFGQWIEEYRRDPEKCKSKQWVDAGFAADWFRGNEKRDRSDSYLPITLSAIQLGPVGLVFHPGELYSYYGLAIRRDSPLADTLVVGCTDGSIGYLPDPEAYRLGGILGDRRAQDSRLPAVSTDRRPGNDHRGRGPVAARLLNKRPLMTEPRAYPLRPENQELYRQAKQLIPGGTQLLSKRPEMFAPDQWPPYYREAHGCEIVDLDGRSYVDMSIMGVGSCLLGYNHPEVTAAVIARIEAGSMATLNCPEEVELARLLIGLHPWADSVRYVRTGGESMAVAVRIARAATGRDLVAFCGYHGWHDWYLAANRAASGEEDHLRGHLLPGLSPKGVPSQLAGTAIPFPYNELDRLAEIVNRDGPRLAAVVMEPTRSVEPAPGFLEGVRELCDRSGAVLVFDEITIGWRLALGGAHLRFGVSPDIAVFAKALGNGHPMAAVIGRARIMQAAQESFISSTYWTEGVGLAAPWPRFANSAPSSCPLTWRPLARVSARGSPRSPPAAGVRLKLAGYPALTTLTFDYPEALALQTAPDRAHAEARDPGRPGLLSLPGPRAGARRQVPCGRRGDLRRAGRGDPLRRRSGADRRSHPSQRIRPAGVTRRPGFPREKGLNDVVPRDARRCARRRRGAGPDRVASGAAGRRLPDRHPVRRPAGAAPAHAAGSGDRA